MALLLDLYNFFAKVFLPRQQLLVLEAVPHLYNFFIFCYKQRNFETCFKSIIYGCRLSSK